MDFLKLLKSFEELVYEALLWFILVPKTLWQIIRRPHAMTAYASAELAARDDRRFNEAISPPLLLILCVLLSQFFDLAVRTPAQGNNGSIASVLLASEQNLLLYRTLAFGIWALAGATYFLLRSRASISRESLRVPFYEQCYLVSPFALLSTSESLIVTDRQGQIVGAVVAGAGAMDAIQSRATGLAQPRRGHHHPVDRLAVQCAAGTRAFPRSFQPCFKGRGARFGTEVVWGRGNILTARSTGQKALFETIASSCSVATHLLWTGETFMPDAHPLERFTATPCPPCILGGRKRTR